MRIARPLLLSFVLSATACSSSPEVKGDRVGGPPQKSLGFPAQTFENQVYAQARFDPGHARKLNVDLIDRLGIVPVSFEIQLPPQSEQAQPVLINDERMNARLFLPDGTSLNRVRAVDVAKRLGQDDSRRVLDLAFRGGLLDDSAESRFLFFQLAPRDGFQASGLRLTHMRNGIIREMDLTHSLLAFDVMIDDRATPFYVGLRR